MLCWVKIIVLTPIKIIILHWCSSLRWCLLVWCISWSLLCGPLAPTRSLTSIEAYILININWAMIRKYSFSNIRFWKMLIVTKFNNKFFHVGWFFKFSIIFNFKSVLQILQNGAWSFKLVNCIKLLDSKCLNLESRGLFVLCIVIAENIRVSVCEGLALITYCEVRNRQHVLLTMGCRLTFKTTTILFFYLSILVLDTQFNTY